MQTAVNPISDRIGTISVSSTMKVASDAEKLRAEGVDVVDFGAGEPDFPTPDNIKQAAVRALEQNFTKYTPAGGRITVGARPAGRMIEIFVSDTGMGIPEEDLPRLFERFYRVDKARSREVGGTGLGLSIVRHVVERMEGTIKVESRLGKGSVFTISFPVLDDSLAA